MKTRSFVIALGIASGICAVPAMAAGTVVAFDKGLGSDPLAANITVNADGTTSFTVIVNSVKIGANPTVNPGGRPWVIQRLKVTVKDDGSISAKGEGLVIAGGANVGSTPAGIKNVGASLFCGTQEFDSGAAPINVNGNFAISGPLSGGALPSACASPVLLIRNAAVATNGTVTLGAWFAAGIPGDAD